MGFFSYLHGFEDVGLLLLRLATGIIFVVHGSGKRQFWKRQPGGQVSPIMRTLMRFLSIAEPIGGTALSLGFLTQLTAACLNVVMIGALILKIGIRNKRFSEDGGWEFEFVLLASNLLLFFTGGGKFALDGFLGLS